MVCFFVSGDTSMPQDPVDLGCDAMGKASLRPSADPPYETLPWAHLQVCHPLNHGL